MKSGMVFFRRALRMVTRPVFIQDGAAEKVTAQVFFRRALRMVTRPVFIQDGAAEMVTAQVFIQGGAVANGDRDGVLRRARKWRSMVARMAFFGAVRNREAAAILL